MKYLSVATTLKGWTPLRMEVRRPKHNWKNSINVGVKVGGMYWVCLVQDCVAPKYQFNDCHILKRDSDACGEVGS